MSDRDHEVLSAQLAKRGVLLLPSGEFALDPSYTGDDAPPEALLDVLNERQQESRVYTRVQLQWAEDLHHIVRRMLAGDSTDPSALQAVFYLRVHGLVVDFAGAHGLAREWVRDRNPTRGSALYYFGRVIGAIESMLGALTEDEQLYAEYRRQVDAHVRQEPYGLQWNTRQARTRDELRSKYTGKTYDVRDLRGRLDGVVCRYGSEAAIALDFARRLEPHATLLVQVMADYCTPKP